LSINSGLAQVGLSSFILDNSINTFSCFIIAWLKIHLKVSIWLWIKGSLQNDVIKLVVVNAIHSFQSKWLKILFHFRLKDYIKITNFNRHMSFLERNSLSSVWKPKKYRSVNFRVHLDMFMVHVNIDNINGFVYIRGLVFMLNSKRNGKIVFL
jgi:hypothetical protein